MVIRMKAVTRLLIFLGVVLVWLVLFTYLNNAYLLLPPAVALMGSLIMGLATTIALAFAFDM